MARRFDSSALGSDVARSAAQYWVRRLAHAIVAALRLNRPGFITTEIVQTINPVATIRTRHGDMYCKAGHGRLLWRAKSFFEEEPETITWLDRLTPDDIYWDIGSNVGLYAIYAAKFRRCRSMAFEPEAQNYALLLENIALNDLDGRCLPAGIALTNETALGRLHVRYITKGGAFNHFNAGTEGGGGEILPESFLAAQKYEPHEGFDQLLFGCSVDDLVFKYGVTAPTYLKIDVDGLEPKIVKGAMRTLKEKPVRSILVELNAKSAEDRAVPDLLAGLGFKQTSERSNWLSRGDVTRAADLPAVNVIFDRG